MFRNFLFLKGTDTSLSLYFYLRPFSLRFKDRNFYFFLRCSVPYILRSPRLFLYLKKDLEGLSLRRTVYGTKIGSLWTHPEEWMCLHSVMSTNFDDSNTNKQWLSFDHETILRTTNRHDWIVAFQWMRWCYYLDYVNRWSDTIHFWVSVHSPNLCHKTCFIHSSFIHPVHASECGH